MALTNSEQIDSVLESLREKENIHRLCLNDEIKELRNHILNVHTYLDDGIDVLLIRHIRNKSSENKNTYTEVEKLQNRKIFLILSKIDFYQKQKLAKELKLITTKTSELCISVNTFRNYFSHPKSYTVEIDNFLDDSQRLKVLKKLDDAAEDIDKYFL